MTELPPLDPFSFWRTVVDQVEKGVNDLARERMQSEEFARLVALVADADIARKKIARAMMRRYFEAIDLPSRSDVMALDERLQSIEDRLLELVATLNAAGTGEPKSAPPSALPRRTRQPIPANDALPPPASVPATPHTAAIKRSRR
jgi:hypothetical protein